MTILELQKSLQNDLAAKVFISVHQNFIDDTCMISARRYYKTLNGVASAFYYIDPILIEDIKPDSELYYKVALSIYKELIIAALSGIGVNYDG